jgi:hypothetical protein
MIIYTLLLLLLLYSRAEKVKRQMEIKRNSETMEVEMRLSLAEKVSELEEMEMENKHIVEKIQKLESEWQLIEEEEERDITDLQSVILCITEEIK